MGAAWLHNSRDTQGVSHDGTTMGVVTGVRGGESAISRSGQDGATDGRTRSPYDSTPVCPRTHFGGGA